MYQCDSVSYFISTGPSISKSLYHEKPFEISALKTQLMENVTSSHKRNEVLTESNVDGLIFSGCYIKQTMTQN